MEMSKSTVTGKQITTLLLTKVDDFIKMKTPAKEDLFDGDMSEVLLRNICKASCKKGNFT